MFRLSLMARRRPPILEHIDGQVERPPRNLYLIQQFNRRIDFLHRQHLFTYVHIQTIEDRIVVGRLGRKEMERAADTPETGYASVRLELHRAINIFLDTAQNPDGQKVGVQSDIKVGSPGSLIKSLVESINGIDPDSPWIIDVQPMTDEASFWDTVDAHENEITSIKFELIAPNIFGFTDSVSREMTSVRDENNGNIVDVVISNKEGILLKTESIKNVMRYISAGGGFVILRGKFKKFFDSRTKKRSIIVENDVVAATEIPETLKEISTKLFGQ